MNVPTDTKDWSEFVRTCEDVIAAENRGWMAKLDDEEKPPTQSPGPPAEKGTTQKT
jgi:hypothetical protein